jgi:hypothetical protein
MRDQTSLVSQVASCFFQNILLNIWIVWEISKHLVAYVDGCRVLLTFQQVVGHFVANCRIGLVAKVPRLLVLDGCIFVLLLFFVDQTQTLECLCARLIVNEHLVQ